MVRSAILTAAMAVLCLAATAQAYDERPLDIGWRMKQDNAIAGAESPAFDDSSWQKVDLPHTWNHIGNLGNTRSPQSNSTQGTGWYRLNFRAAPAMGKRYFMQFDGVGEIADVWLNGQYLGRHMGAFQRFRFDATKALKPGGDNVLVVKADNSRPAPGSSTQDIIPLSGDFFIHGGIYRQVSLITTDPVHIDLMDFGGPGVYARATAIAGDTASVEVRNRLANDGAGTQKVSVETRIEDGSGASVAVETDADTLKNGVTEDRHVLQIKHPHLWDGVTDPYLYRVVVTVRDAKGAVLDMVVQPLGLRSFRFDANTGFYLNGHPVQMRGASRHQDRPTGIGWAITKADIAQDFDLMQDMGANAVRLAHYQHDQFAYEETDRRGLMVWAEIPLVNAVSYDGSPPNAAFVANSENQFRELIRQNYNHPSIIMWSVGNETDLTPTQQKTTSKQGALIKALSDIGHAED
ncbi:MAG: glycoside hydrolase family 2 protein, partial [Asticcacaulis sp.]